MSALLPAAEASAELATPQGAALPAAAAEAPPAAAPHDGLLVGMAFLLAMTVVQRGVGLARNVLFCRWLDPEELGRWNLAFSFLMLAAPLVVLGLPGSFGRYAEHYRKTGRLRTFLRRTGWASALMTLLAAAAIAAAPQTFAEIVFRDSSQTRLMVLAAVALAAVTAFNFFTELFTALRRARIASMMQFAHALIFAGTALALLATTSWGAGAVVLAYGAACAAACGGGALALAESWRAAPQAKAPLGHARFWLKLMPFAAWIWATNLLANLSDVADRYMILYFAGADAAAASALVGQYHSSRVAPELLASLASMLAAVLLPYNSHDWEAGDRAAVSRRVNLALKLTGWAFTAAGAALLMIAQPLFAWVLEGKYELGQEILPWTLVLCIGFSLSVLALNYLWCAERAGLAVLAIAVGLACNIALNLVLLPLWGLRGAAIATAAANAASLACAYWLSCRQGMQADRGVLAASLTPLTLLLGPAAALAAVLALAGIAVRSPWILRPEDKSVFAQALRQSSMRRARPS